MAKTMDELEAVLTAKGYSCRRIYDQALTTRIPTSAYRNLAGDRSIDVQFSFDQRHGCLTVDTPWAFDTRKALHKEAMMACLLSASGQMPLVKAQLDPGEGEVRLRVDCRCGSEGVAADDILKVVSLIPEFADRWYPHIMTAMEDGVFDPAGRSGPSDADGRLESLARRAGGVNRLRTLLWLRDRNN